jgi:hypothetical protein
MGALVAGATGVADKQLLQLTINRPRRPASSVASSQKGCQTSPDCRERGAAWVLGGSRVVLDKGVMIWRGTSLDLPFRVLLSGLGP